jgi:hypothetical protein
MEATPLVFLLRHDFNIKCMKVAYTFTKTLVCYNSDIDSVVYQEILGHEQVSGQNTTGLLLL